MFTFHRAPLGGPQREVLRYRACRLDIKLPLGRQNFKEDHLFHLVRFLCRLHDIFAFVRHICAFLQFPKSRCIGGDAVALYRSLTAYSRHVLRRNLNYFILLVSLFDCLFLLMTIITVTRKNSSSTRKLS